jgi:hypothetical protein
VEAKAALLVISFCMLTQWERICRAHWLLESAEIFGNNDRACCGHLVRNSVIACYVPGWAAKARGQIVAVKDRGYSQMFKLNAVRIHLLLIKSTIIKKYILKLSFLHMSINANEVQS